MADDISKNWVLHAHVKNVIANQYNYKPVSLSSGGFHLKDKATASGGDGPSVNVKTAHVKDDAENTLLTYIDDKKHAIRKKWFKAGYMVSE